MRRVVSSSEVAHLWANKIQSDARNPQGNIYFEGDTIWSYGPHFPMARHVDGVVLITTKTWSVTTSKHQSEVAYACNQLTRFHVPDIMACTKDQHKANFNDYRERYEAAVLRATRATVYGSQYMASAKRIREQANEYSRHFKIRVQIKPMDDVRLKKLTDKHKAAAAIRLAAKKKREAERVEGQKIALAKWRAGILHHSIRLSWIDVALRLSADGLTVQTSKGVNFPADHARRALPILHRCVRLGREWHTNGHAIHLGNYKIDMIYANGDVRAGCHFVTYKEVLHLEGLLQAAGGKDSE